MSTYRIIYHEEVTTDAKEIPKNLLKRLRKAIDDRLMKEPLKYGEPLRGPLQGFRKLRVGDYRIVYEVVGMVVRVWAMIHRKKVYPRTTVRRRRPFRPRQ